MASLLYCKQANKIISPCENNDISWFSLTPFHLYQKSENISLKTLLVRWYFSIITGGQARVYYYMVEGKIVHTSVVIPKCFKFPYMENKSYCIGPCQTNIEYRGQGIYPKTIAHILNDQKYIDSKIYMVVNDTNKSSIRGIEKSGFRLCGTIRKSKFLKRYYMEDNTSDT